MNLTALAAAVVTVGGAFVFATSSPPLWATGLGLALAGLVVFVDAKRDGLFKRRNDP